MSIRDWIDGKMKGNNIVTKLCRHMGIVELNIFDEKISDIYDSCNG